MATNLLAADTNPTNLPPMFVEVASTIGTSTQQHTVLNEPPVDDWCFDLIVFYKSIAEEDVNALNVLAQLKTYSKFSFVVNGLVTCLLASFGLLGNILFVCQLYKSRYFSRRLASHLAMLCIWDMALLLCCLLTYGIMASYYGILPFVGVVAYLLYFFQPFASFCVTGTIWQVLAITVERYNAVSKPLEQRTRNAQFSLKTICGSIAMGAFLLNMVVVPLERRLTDCYEFTQNGFQIRKMIVQQDLVNNQFYAILVHLVPDIIFRAPTPIILIAILTVRTLQICSRRTVGSQTIQQARRNIPLMLTLLNVKFIMCNTLYMFNTILMEVMGYGGKTSSQQTELEMEQYISSLYLTDFSNMLLALHSATNWLIFYRWGNWSALGNKKRKFSSLTMTNSNHASKNTMLDVDSVELLVQKFSADKYKTAGDILATLCANSLHMARLLVGKEVEDEWHQKSVPVAKDYFAQNARIQKNAIVLGDVIEEVLRALANKSSTILEWRDLCRKIGYCYHTVSLHCSAEQWKLVRHALILSVGQNPPPRWQSSKVHQMVLSGLQKTMLKTFSLALREMKSGALCAMVDASHQHVRLQKHGIVGPLYKPIFRYCDSLNEPGKINGVSLKRHNSEDLLKRRYSELHKALLRSCESLSLIIPRVDSIDCSTTPTPLAPSDS